MHKSVLFLVGLGVIVLAFVYIKFGTQPSDITIQREQTQQQETEPRNDFVPPGSYVTVYDGIDVPASTTVLDLSGKNLSGSLKAEIRLVPNLIELNLSDNNLTGLPAEVGQLSNLEVLNLSNNPFTGLPYELGNLQQLRVLDVRQTQYSKQDLEVIKQGLSASVEIVTD